MKTLANCNPIEFLIQTNKIRKAVENWLTLTKVMDIRKNMPKLPEGATQEEKRQLMTEQIKKNSGAMLDSMLEQYPQETAELLGLVCFIEPADLPNHKMSEFLGAFTEIVNTPEVIDFFISLASLENLTISDTAKA